MQIEYSLATGARKWVHEWTVDGQSQCQYHNAFLPFLYLRATNESLRTMLTIPYHGLRKTADIAEWIVQQRPSGNQQGSHPANIVIAIEKLSKDPSVRI
jgi:hypothetical protein